MRDKSMLDRSGLSFSTLSEQSIHTDLMPLQNESISESDEYLRNNDSIPLFDDVHKSDKELSILFTEKEL